MAASVRALGSVVILCVMMTSASHSHQGHSDYKHRVKRTPLPVYSKPCQTKSARHGVRVERGRNHAMGGVRGGGEEAVRSSSAMRVQTAVGLAWATVLVTATSDCLLACLSSGEMRAP